MRRSISPCLPSQVHDGPDETAPTVGRYCGQQLPPPYTSSGPDLWIKFKSDVSQTGSGFRMEYTVACGGTFTGRVPWCGSTKQEKYKKSF